MLAQIDKRSHLSIAEFEREYSSKSLPVILTDAFDHWPARSKWSFNFFEKHYAEKRVKFDHRDWRIGDLIERLRIGRVVDGERTPYLKMVKIDEQFRELWGDLGAIEVARNNRLRSRFLPRTMRLDRGSVALFIGAEGSGFRTLHWDYSYLHVFISQILGDKDFILFPPGDTPYLYPKPDVENTSSLPDPFEVDLNVFPDFSKARGTFVRLKEGETIFLPGGWWHATRIDQPNIAIAESTLDGFNWRQRSRWYLDQYAHAGVPWLKRQAMKVYLGVAQFLM